MKDYVILIYSYSPFLVSVTTEQKLNRPSKSVTASQYGVLLTSPQILCRLSNYITLTSIVLPLRYILRYFCSCGQLNIIFNTGTADLLSCWETQFTYVRWLDRNTITAVISSFRREVAGNWFLLGYYPASSGKGITTTRCVMTQKSAVHNCQRLFAAICGRIPRVAVNRNNVCYDREFLLTDLTDASDGDAIPGFDCTWSFRDG
jgi:hypothetical protein